MSAPALSPSQLSPEVKGRRRPLGQPFRFASPPLPPLLDSASAPPALDDVSFLSLDDSQSFLTECGSVNSMKSYPHNLWATPSHADYPITSEKMAIRSYLRRSHRSQVKKRRRRLALAKERRTLRLIKEHERRVELLKIKHQRRKVAQKWLDVLAHRAVYSKVVSVFEDADKARRENEQRKMELKRLSATASIIQKAVRSKLLKDLNGQHWQQVARFAGLMRRNRWRCTLGLRCWRRYNARNVVRDFLKQTAKMQGGRAILVFQQRVRYAQRLVRDWVRVRKRRMAFLRTARGGVLRRGDGVEAAESRSPNAGLGGGRGGGSHGNRREKTEEAGRAEADGAEDVAGPEPPGGGRGHGSCLQRSRGGF